MFPAFSIGAGSRIVGSDVLYNDNQTGQTQIIPKGSLAIASIMMMQRDSQIFDNPDQFQPRRWETATEEQRLAIVPYALGAQNCVGQTLANAVIPLTIGQLLCDHQVTLVQEGPVVCAGSIKPVGTKLAIRKCSQ